MKKILFTCIVILFFILTLKAEKAEDFFKKNCFSCHTIGGGKFTGPDLKNIHLRKDEAWLLKFIQTPEEILRSGDTYDAKILKEAKAIRMTRVEGTTPSIVSGLLKFIKEESLKEKSVFAKSPRKNMKFAFSFQKILDGNGIKISITGMIIVFFVLSTITISLFLLPKVLRVVNRFFPEEEEEEIDSNMLDKDKEIAAAIGYALLKSK